MLTLTITQNSTHGFPKIISATKKYNWEKKKKNLKLHWILGTVWKRCKGQSKSSLSLTVSVEVWRGKRIKNKKNKKTPKDPRPKERKKIQINVSIALRYWFTNVNTKNKTKSHFLAVRVKIQNQFTFSFQILSQHKLCSVKSSNGEIFDARLRQFFSFLRILVSINPAIRSHTHPFLIFILTLSIHYPPLSKSPLPSVTCPLQSFLYSVLFLHT